MAEQVDHLVVGSSPVALLEGLHLAHSGGRVQLIEGRDRLGGAWATIDVPPFRNVELGPHFIKRRPNLYEMFESIGVPLDEMTPPASRFLDQKILGFECIRYDQSWIARNLDLIAPLSGPARWLRTGRFLYSLTRSRLGLGAQSKHEPMRYFAEGSQHFIDHVTSLLEAVTANIQTGVEVEKIQAESGQTHARIETTAGPLEAREVIFTSGSRLSDVEIDGEIIGLEDEPQIHREVIVIAHLSAESRFSFIKMPGSDPLLLMASDATRYTKRDHGSDPELRCFVMRLHPEIEPDEAIAKAALKRLHELELVGDLPKLVTWMDFEIPVPMRRAERMQQLNERCAPWMRGLYSYDIGISLLEQRTRWEPTISAIQRGELSRASHLHRTQQLEKQ